MADDDNEINASWLQRGERVGLYEIEQLVGRGGFGALYRARRDGQAFALKIPIVKVPAIPEPERLLLEQRIMREVVSMMSLSHPNIVRVHAFDRWPNSVTGFLYIVMDFIDGVTLDIWCARFAPSARRITEVFRKISLAVYEMHRLGIFHRDLKSENVLVRATDGEPIIVDFGLSRPSSAHSVTGDNSVLGTYTHWSPEYVTYINRDVVLPGDRFPNRPTADLHAVGYMLYEGLTGRPPFSAKHRWAMQNEILNTIPQRPSLVNPELPNALDEVVMKLLEKDPGRRYQTGLELANALAEALSSP